MSGIVGCQMGKMLFIFLTTVHQSDDRVIERWLNLYNFGQIETI